MNTNRRSGLAKSTHARAQEYVVRGALLWTDQQCPVVHRLWQETRIYQETNRRGLLISAFDSDRMSFEPDSRGQPHLLAKAFVEHLCGYEPTRILMRRGDRFSNSWRTITQSDVAISLASIAELGEPAVFKSFDYDGR